MGNHCFADNEGNPTCESERKRKMLSFSGEEEIEAENVSPKRVNRNRERNGKPEEEMGYEEREWGLKPLDKVVEFSIDGEGPRIYYRLFEYAGVHYKHEDYVLVTPEHENEKPYVAIIRSIFKTHEEPLMIGVQWFYRPEDVAVDGDGKYQSDDARELFYSFHTDEVPAESVKHKCDVFLYNSNRNGKELLSFNVKGVYFHDRKQLYKLTGKVDRDGKQQECNLSSYGRLTNRDKFSKYLLETLLSPMFNQHNDKQENAGSDVPTAGHNFNDLNQINKSHMDIHQDVEPEKGGSDVRSLTASYRNGASNSLDISPHKTQNDEVSMEWFGKAILAAAHLEEAVHNDLSMDACKYNKKMRQLIFNFKKTARLALRLLNGELAPGKILTMTPNELKAGLTEEEMPSKEPEKPTHSQNPTVDKCCERCPQKKVALKSVPGPISSLTSYKLECVACGWFTVVKDYVPNI